MIKSHIFDVASESIGNMSKELTTDPGVECKIVRAFRKARGPHRTGHLLGSGRQFSHLGQRRLHCPAVGSGARLQVPPSPRMTQVSQT